MTATQPPAENPAASPAPPPPALLPALAKFERGDFRGASAEAQALLRSADPEVQAAARALVDRMATDPWAVRVGLLALTLLALVAGVYAH